MNIGRIQSRPVNFSALYLDNGARMQKAIDAVPNANEHIEAIEKLADGVSVDLSGGRTFPYDSPNSVYFFKLKQSWDNVICEARFKPDASVDECEKEWESFEEQFEQDKQFGYTFASRLVQNYNINFYLGYDRQILVKKLTDFINRDPEVAKALSGAFEAVERLSKSNKDTKFHVWHRENENNIPVVKFAVWDKSGELTKSKPRPNRRSYSDKYRHMNVKKFIAEASIERGTDSEAKIKALKEFSEKISQSFQHFD